MVKWGEVERLLLFFCNSNCERRAGMRARARQSVYRWCEDHNALDRRIATPHHASQRFARNVV